MPELRGPRETSTAICTADPAVPVTCSWEILQRASPFRMTKMPFEITLCRFH